MVAPFTELRPLLFRSKNIPSPRISFMPTPEKNASEFQTANDMESCGLKRVHHRKPELQSDSGRIAYPKTKLAAILTRCEPQFMQIQKSPAGDESRPVSFSEPLPNPASQRQADSSSQCARQQQSKRRGHRHGCARRGGHLQVGKLKITGRTALINEEIKSRYAAGRI